MPRKPALSPEEIYKVLKNFNFTDELRCFLPSRHKIWTKASFALDKKMSPLHVYTYVTSNRHKISDRLHGFQVKSRRKQNGRKIIFGKTKSIDESIIFTQEEWIRMGVHLQDVNGRTRYAFVSGWTDIICKNLWRKFKIACPYTFKTCTITEDDDYQRYNIKGTCSECGNYIHLLSLTDCNENGIKFSVSTKDCRNIKHHKKRQLRGATRTKVCQELNGKSAELWRLETAACEMSFGDTNHPSLYSSNVLRKAKQLQKDQNLGLNRQNETIIAIYNLKNQQQYNKIIHNIVARKFYMTYWLPEQVKFYNLFTEMTTFLTISIDATGSVIKSSIKPNESSCNIFLYQAVAHFNHRTIPIFQLLSEKHDTNILLYWINQWLSEGVPQPTQVVTDYSLALINASTLAFNQKTLDQYVIYCYNIITSVISMNKNITLHRIDIAHLIKFISRWKCLNDHDHKNIKTFYLYCIGVLVKSTDLEDFKKILIAILIVANFPSCNSKNIQNKCFQAYSFLLKRIETACLSTIEDINIGNDDDQSDNETLDICTNIEINHNNFQKFYESIKQEMNGIEDGNQNNEYYCPDFARKLLNLTKTFVLWTNIMTHLYFQQYIKIPSESEKQQLDKIYTASSARSEQYFCKLKTIIMNNQKCGRIDEFVIQHIQSLKGEMNLAMEEYLYLVDNNDQSSILNKTSIHDESKRSTNQLISANSIAIETSSNDIDNKKNITTQEGSLYVVRNINTKKRILSFEENGALVNEQSIIKDLHSTDRKTEDIGKILDLTHDDEGSTISSDEEESVDKYESKDKYTLELNNTSLENLNSIKMERCIKLLKNGNEMPAIETSEGVLLLIKNTCAFDSVVECIAAGYQQFLTLRKHINCSNNGLFRLVRLLWTCDDSSIVYRIRADLLSKGKQIKNNSLNCIANACSIVQSILYQEPSIIIDVECKDCTRNRNEKIPVLSPDMENIWDNGITFLQKTIDDWIIGFVKRYKKLNHSEIITIHTRYHLFIDLEGVHCRSSYVQKNMKEIPLISLDKIPSNIIFNQHTYQLVGAIEHKIMIKVDHYKSFIRNEKAEWFCYDDCSVHDNPHKLKHGETEVGRSVSLLFYVVFKDN